MKIMNVACSVAEIKKQLEQLPESLETCNQLHQLETALSQSTGRPYRSNVKKILTSIRKRIKKRSNKKGRKNLKDCRNKANGGAGRKDRRNVIRGGIGRSMMNTSSAGSVNATESQSLTGISQCNELRDFWWNHSSDAAVLASCCASHEAAVHTFWSVEEWLLHIASATTGINTIIY